MTDFWQNQVACRLNVVVPKEFLEKIRGRDSEQRRIAVRNILQVPDSLTVLNDGSTRWCAPPDYEHGSINPAYLASFPDNGGDKSVENYYRKLKARFEPA